MKRKSISTSETSEKEVIIDFVNQFDKGKGLALFFCLSGKSNKSLSPFQVIDDRISPDEVDTKIPNSCQSGPLFLECCNFFSIPNSCSGMSCAFILPKTFGRWQFGFVNCIIPASQVMEIFVWVGSLLNVKDTLYPN